MYIEIKLTTRYATAFVWVHLHTNHTSAERGIESWAVPRAGFELVAEKVHGIAGGSPLAAVKSVAEMDERSRKRGALERTIGARRFTLVSGVWTDARYTPSMRTVTVTPFSW